jgi:N-acetyl-anhydromuramyl-L-alanine amidase AmpD
MRDIRLIVIHCSATPNDRTLIEGKPGAGNYRNPAQVINEWHRARKFKRGSYWRGRKSAALDAIGYHFVIGRNGAIYEGRDEEELGAHVAGWNAHSIGICMVGLDQYTPEQYDSLENVVRAMATRYSIPLQPPKLMHKKASNHVLEKGICGHRDLSPDADGDGTVERHEWLKTCPGFNVADWLKTIGGPK